MFIARFKNAILCDPRLFAIVKPKTEDDYGMDGMEDVGEYIAHHRAWSYIKDCLIDDEVWQGSLQIQHDDHLETSVKLSISFFEDAEEYEKCAHLVKIQKYLKDSLESKS